jgi:hypothetical protein
MCAGYHSVVHSQKSLKILEPHQNTCLDFFNYFYFYLMRIFWDKGLTMYHYVPHTGLILMILLPQPPRFWDYRHVLPCLALELFKTELDSSQTHDQF